VTTVWRPSGGATRHLLGSRLVGTSFARYLDSDASSRSSSTLFNMLWARGLLGRFVPDFMCGLHINPQLRVRSMAFP
jgi:hypothetical protein